MRTTKSNCLLAIAIALLVSTSAYARDWYATAGAQTPDQSRQALAFFPSEMWVHAGDSITWTFKANDVHTVTFLTPGQIRPPFQVGCPGFTPGSGVFDGTACLSTPPLTSGQKFTVTFPQPGNFKLVCLVHEDMTATIHVLPTTATLPHGQSFYNLQAAQQIQYLLTADGLLEGHQHLSGPHQIAAGVGQVTANAGGHQTISVMRFLQPELMIHAGDTVEWTNDDSITPHTITFGPDPANPVQPSSNVTMSPDGALHATISSTADVVHSGFIASAAQDQIGLPQTPLSVTRFRVTFTKAGIYPYKCVLHDNLGMVGRIVVMP